MRLHAALVGIVATVGGCVIDEAADDGIAFGTDGDGKADGTGALPLIQTNSPFYWADSDYAAFVTTATEVHGMSLGTPIADTDPLTARLQGWVDRLDAMVRTELERSMGEPLVAPKPIMKVVPSGHTYNAWVSGAIACMGTQVANAPADSASKTLLTTREVYHGAFAACVQPTYPEVSDFRTFWERHKPACKLGADMTVGGAGCAEQSYSSPGELSFISTSPYIHMTTDLIASVPEATVVVILAHELAHYYRSHVSDAKVQRYGFWYETELDRKKLPVPSTLANELAAAYAEITAGPESMQPAIAGHYSARLRPWILSSIAPLLLERNEPNFVCAAARSALGPWTDGLLAGYGMPVHEVESYLAFERALVACAPRLQMGSGGSATSLSYGTVLMSVPSAKLPGASFPFYASLADVLSSLNARAVRLDDKAASLQRRVRDNRIGLYTTEQEADNIALALSIKLGMRPDQVLTAWQDFMTAIVDVVPESHRAQYAQETAQCKSQLAADFTELDADGKRVPIFVSMGDLGSAHHSDCYRLFNFWREQKLRKYAPTRTITFDGGWDALRAQAKQLSDLAGGY
jgi:hypothetical protein